VRLTQNRAPVKYDPALRELWCAFISAALLVVIASCFKPLMQPHYDHHFHEARTVLHIVTFSNVPFFGIGVWAYVIYRMLTHRKVVAAQLS
jgi:glucan phosphoethanolaminetransferase (alkaline phosphatase superfamily)